jgi:hypothetical protein
MWASCLAKLLVLLLFSLPPAGDERILKASLKAKRAVWPLGQPLFALSASHKPVHRQSMETFLSLFNSLFRADASRDSDGSRRQTSQLPTHALVCVAVRA